MGSFARKAGGVGVAMLAGAALTAAPSIAQATEGRARHVKVPCSTGALANEINTANGLSAPTVLILKPHCNYEYNDPYLAGGPNALPVITKDITLTGGPATSISRKTGATGGSFRLLEVGAGGTLRIRNIFLVNGVSANTGGGIKVTAGRLVLDHVSLSGNRTTTHADGGGLDVESGAQAVILHSLISGNTAGAATVGNTASGGGVSNAGKLTLFESRLTLNSSTASAPGGGGGLITKAAPAESNIVRSTFDHNLAAPTTAGGGLGGGILTLATGTTNVNRAVIVSNRAADGGGVHGPRVIAHSVIRNNEPNNCANPSSPCGS
jgi:hypothetical protein